MYLSKVDIRLRLYTGFHLYKVDENFARCLTFCDSVSDVLIRIYSELTAEFERRGQSGDYSSLRVDGKEINNYLTSYSRAVAATDRLNAFVEDLAPLEEETFPPAYAADFETLLDATRSAISAVNALEHHLDAIVVHREDELTVQEHPLDAYNQAKDEVPQLIRDTGRHIETFRESYGSLMPKLEYGYQKAIKLAVEDVEDPLADGSIEDIVVDIKSKRYIEPTTSQKMTPEQAEADAEVADAPEDEGEREATNEDSDPVEEIGAVIDLSSITINSARDLFTRVQRHDLPRGTADEAVYCAVLYTACRQDGIPRSPDDLEAATGVDRRAILDTVSAITDALDVVLAPAHPRPFVERYASELEINPETRALAEAVVKELDRNGRLAGRPPASIAAGVLYAVARQTDERITQQTVADVSGVSEVSIRKEVCVYPEDATAGTV